MPTRLRKVRRLRGSRLHGWGVSGQHRDSGSQGGRGEAGRFKHNWSRILREGRQIGKHGFRSLRPAELRTVNVSELEELLTPRPVEARKREGPLTVDLDKLGYQKLLGKGAIHIPIAVTVNRFSKLAAEKIEKAGGKILPAG